MIEYENQIHKFMMLTQRVKISCSAQTLYIHIIEKFKSIGYPSRLRIDNYYLRANARLSKNQFFNARKELEELCLITYTPGGGSASGEYTLTNLSDVGIEDLIKNSNRIVKTKNSEPEIDNISKLKESFKYLADEDKIWANYIIRLLKGVISKSKSITVNGTYKNVIDFIYKSKEINYGFIFKLITVLKNKKNISDKEAYVLSSISNYVEEKGYFAEEEKERDMELLKQQYKERISAQQ